MHSAPFPQPAAPMGARERSVRRQCWLWAFNVLLLGAAVGLWQKLQWKKTSDTPSGMVWQRMNTTHTDRNRDGRVDEEIIRQPNGDAAIRRDTDLDGWFDLRYLERKGLATQPTQIHEEAPKR